MPSVEIRPGIFWIGLNDRTTDLFEGIWPVSDAGVTYNSYLIRDTKNVIIDLAKGFKTDEYFEKIESIVPLSEIDYIVVNHMEPDHTGAIRAISRISPRLPSSPPRGRAKCSRRSTGSRRTCAWSPTERSCQSARAP